LKKGTRLEIFEPDDLHLLHSSYGDVDPFVLWSKQDKDIIGLSRKLMTGVSLQM